MRRKGFDVSSWRAKCRCKCGSDQHGAAPPRRCRSCGCGRFESDFLCVVCDLHWEEHSTVTVSIDTRANGRACVPALLLSLCSMALPNPSLTCPVCCLLSFLPSALSPLPSPLSPLPSALSLSHLSSLPLLFRWFSGLRGAIAFSLALTMQSHSLTAVSPETKSVLGRNPPQYI